jgi:hypothetical protein
LERSSSSFDRAIFPTIRQGVGTTILKTTEIIGSLMIDFGKERIVEALQKCLEEHKTGSKSNVSCGRSKGVLSLHPASLPS